MFENLLYSWDFFHFTMWFTNSEVFPGSFWRNCWNIWHSIWEKSTKLDKFQCINIQIQHGPAPFSHFLSHTFQTWWAWSTESGRLPAPTSPTFPHLQELPESQVWTSPLTSSSVFRKAHVLNLFDKTVCFGKCEYLILQTSISVVMVTIAYRI